MDPLPLRFAPAGDDNGRLTRSQNATIRVIMWNMKISVAILAGSIAAATPASAIQEVVLGPRAPSFAAVSSMGLGWERLQAPAFTGGTAERDPRQWAFAGGTTEKLGSFLFNTASGPSWAVNNGFGLSSGMGSFARGFGDLGFTTRNTTAIMASQSLMFYTSVGATTYGSGASIIPTAPGLSLLERPSTQMDVRAGFKMELMPGLTFGAEAAFAPSMR